MSSNPGVSESINYHVFKKFGILCQENFFVESKFFSSFKIRNFTLEEKIKNHIKKSLLQGRIFLPIKLGFLNFLHRIKSILFRIKATVHLLVK